MTLQQSSQYAYQLTRCQIYRFTIQLIDQVLGSC